MRTDDEWASLCETLGRSELASDPRFATFEARKAHEDALDVEIEAWTLERDPWQVMHLLQANGVPAGVVADLEDLVVRDPQMSVDHLRQVGREGETVEFTTHAQPIRLDGQSPPLRRAPTLGQDNEYVFLDLLGLSEEQYRQALIDEVVF